MSQAIESRRATCACLDIGLCVRTRHVSGCRVFVPRRATSWDVPCQCQDIDVLTHDTPVLGQSCNSRVTDILNKFHTRYTPIYCQKWQHMHNSTSKSETHSALMSTRPCPATHGTGHSQRPARPLSYIRQNVHRHTHTTYSTRHKTHRTKPVTIRARAYTRQS